MHTAGKLEVGKVPRRPPGVGGVGARAERLLGILLWIALVLTVVGIGAS